VDSTKPLIGANSPAEIIKVALEEHAAANQLCEIALENQSDEEEVDTDVKSQDWPSSQIIKLFLIGIAITLTTNLPSAFTHTSINTAFAEVNLYLNVSYESRGIHLDMQDYVWLRSIIGACWYAGQVRF
jgi:hypothetical protein